MERHGKRWAMTRSGAKVMTEILWSETFTGFAVRIEPKRTSVGVASFVILGGK